MKNINRNKKLKLSFEMLRIREIEKSISSNYKHQKMRCPIHLSIGQEAIAVGVCQNLTNKNKIVTAHSKILRSLPYLILTSSILSSITAKMLNKIAIKSKISNTFPQYVSDSKMIS